MRGTSTAVRRRRSCTSAFYDGLLCSRVRPRQPAALHLRSPAGVCGCVGRRHFIIDPYTPAATHSSLLSSRTSQPSSSPPRTPTPVPPLPPPPASDDAHDWSSTYHRSHVSLNLPQRVFLASSSALLSLLDTHRADLVAAFIESTSASALPTLLSRLRSSPSGARLLALKPRITPHSIAHLSLLPPHTLGGAYHAFLSSHAYSPASRPLTRWVDGEDAAWVVQRYREVHDVWHTVTACDVSVVGELAQKVFEWRQTGLPGLLAAGLGGGLRVGRVERGTWAEGVSWGWRAGGNSEFLLGVHWEELWEEDLNDLRQRLHIEVAPPALRAPQ